MIQVRSTPRRIYLASSWRNKFYRDVHDCIAAAGHEVYDFREPVPGNDGFKWQEVDAAWESWTPDLYIQRLRESPAARHGYAYDKEALDWCDTCVLLLPCGRSAHLEAGYAIGRGKETIFYIRPEGFEPELMYLLGDDFVTTDTELVDVLKRRRPHAKLASA